MHWFKIRINEKTSYFLYYIINLTRLPLNVSNSLHQKFIFSSSEIFLAVFFFSLIIIWTQKKKIILIGAWVLIDPDWLPHRLSHEYGNLKQSNIDMSDLLLTSKSEYRPGSFTNLNLFLSRTFAWVINMTHSQFVNSSLLKQWAEYFFSKTIQNDRRSNNVWFILFFCDESFSRKRRSSFGKSKLCQK